MRIDPEVRKQFIEIARVYGEATKLLAEAIRKAFRETIEVIKESEDITKRKKVKVHNYNWSVPKVIGMSDQVLTRKPITINIRTNL